MIVDTSALIAILLDEPGSTDLARGILAASGARISAGSVVEAQVVASHRHGDVARQAVLTLIDDLALAITDVTAAQAAVAGQAYAQYGRGSGSKARLNFGDCFAYALAIETGEPLLWVGDDFTHTDIARPS